MLFKKMTELITSFDGDAGIAIKNLVTDEIVFSWQPDAVFPAASTIKTPILMALLDLVAAGRISLDTEVEVNRADFVGGGGLIEHLSVPKVYTIHDFALLMIIKSDNLATNKLIDLVGMEAVNAKMTEMGMTSSILRRKMMDKAARQEGRENLTTAQDLVAAYAYIHAHSARYSLALEMLHKQLNNTKLPYLIDPPAPFAHKGGSLSGILHDAGIFFFEEPVAIAVMTGNLKSEMQAKLFFNQIGKAVADHCR